jgi:hypothetical protein
MEYSKAAKKLAVRLKSNYKEHSFKPVSTKKFVEIGSSSDCDYMDNGIDWSKSKI